MLYLRLAGSASKYLTTKLCDAWEPELIATTGTIDRTK